MMTASGLMLEILIDENSYDQFQPSKRRSIQDVSVAEASDQRHAIS